MSGLGSAAPNAAARGHARQQGARLEAGFLQPRHDGGGEALLEAPGLIGTFWRLRKYEDPNMRAGDGFLGAEIRDGEEGG